MDTGSLMGCCGCVSMFPQLKDGITTKTWVSWLMWLLFLYRTTNLFRLVVLRSDDDYHISSLPTMKLESAHPQSDLSPTAELLMTFIFARDTGLVGLTIRVWTMATISWHFQTHCCVVSYQTQNVATMHSHITFIIKVTSVFLLFPILY